MRTKNLGHRQDLTSSLIYGFPQSRSLLNCGLHTFKKIYKTQLENFQRSKLLDYLLQTQLEFQAILKASLGPEHFPKITQSATRMTLYTCQASSRALLKRRRHYRETLARKSQTRLSMSHRQLALPIQLSKQKSISQISSTHRVNHQTYVRYDLIQLF